MFSEVSTGNGGFYLDRDICRVKFSWSIGFNMLGCKRMNAGSYELLKC